VHVSDGKSTDGNPQPELESLAQNVASTGGKLLVTNIHLSENGDATKPVLFPTPAEAATLDDHGKMLFEMSSEVPDDLRESLNVQPGARMMVYNAGLNDLAKVFKAGSSAASVSALSQ
jgi:hypothetical protein